MSDDDLYGADILLCRSLLRQSLAHMLKADSWPTARDAPVWRADAISSRQEARAAYTPAMHDGIDVQELYEQARRTLPTTMDGMDPLPVPDACPVTLEELLAVDPTDVE
jgi:hypothetical protein